MRCLTAVFLLCCIGCRMGTPPNSAMTLPQVQQEALNRNLAGDTAAALEQLAASTRRSSRWKNLPDLAAFVRQCTGDKGDELCREILWESVEFCNVQFSDRPDLYVRELRAGELRCRTASILAEKQFLDTVAWKTADQQQREIELRSELLQLTGDIPDSRLAAILLAQPGDEPLLPAGLYSPVSEDPAEALQIAGVICLLPREIRQQQLADDSMPLTGILNEITFLAGSYILHAGRKHLDAAKRAFLQDPSPENLWLYRKWYYRMMLDISRMPKTRGNEKERQFIASMLLLQENF